MSGRIIQTQIKKYLAWFCRFYFFVLKSLLSTINSWFFLQKNGSKFLVTNTFFWEIWLISLRHFTSVIRSYLLLNFTHDLARSILQWHQATWLTLLKVKLNTNLDFKWKYYKQLNKRLNFKTIFFYYWYYLLLSSIA